jgi:peptidoglycan/xylan/chitin deacetylase (PgdA/CDA1 family)
LPRPATGAQATAVERLSLLAPAYHRAREGALGNSPAMFEAHFRHIAENYRCVLPGDHLDPDRLNVCLTFEDGYFDFHQEILPLLERFDLRAVLAVAPGLIPAKVELSAAGQRVRADGAAKPHEIPETLCTWDELRTIARSGRVAFAAHGLNRIPLDRSKIDVDREIVYPGEFLSSLLGVKVDSFVFPFGRHTSSMLAAARQSYRHVFLNGSAMNAGWSASALFRVDADQMKTPDGIFAPDRLRAYRWRAWWNRLRLL